MQILERCQYADDNDDVVDDDAMKTFLVCAYGVYVCTCNGTSRLTYFMRTAFYISRAQIFY